MEVRLALECGERKTISLKQGKHDFMVRFVDLPNELVEVYRCLASVCKAFHYDKTDGYGILTFTDEITGLSTITYRFVVKGKVFAELNVIPVIIDVNEILEKTTSLLETLIVAKRLI